jgi:hypothetical protein
MTMPGRRRSILAAMAAVLLVGAVALVVGLRPRGPTPGPLQPTDVVDSFGLPADDGSTISLVVEFRGETEAVATLRSVSLADPDAGLTLVGTGILTGPFEGYVLSSYPPGPLRPVEGTVIATKPGDRSGDIFFVLGIRTDLHEGSQSARGVWLDYTVDGVAHRALLPTLLTVCPKVAGGSCEGQPIESFKVPAPEG